MNNLASILHKTNRSGDCIRRCLSKVAEDYTFPKHVVRKLGQVTSITHPHILRDDELCPGTNASEFKQRRDKLMDMIFEKSEMSRSIAKYHMVVVPSATKIYMTEKIPYVFRQNSDFLYLTGFLEPDTALVLSGDRDGYISTLFVRNQDEHSKLWDGPRTGVDEACAIFGIDQALPMDNIENFLSSNGKGHSGHVLYYDSNQILQDKLNRIVTKYIQSHTPEHHETIRQFIHELRLYKSKSEQDLLRNACDIASKAIVKTIAFSNVDVSEHQLFAKVDFECRMNGAQILAYPPVVASGNNANVIHYISNNQRVHDGELILMDAGCEYYGYCSDITRTWPVSGSFTDAQRVLYEVVLQTQIELINTLVADRLPLDSIYAGMLQVLCRKLQEAKVIKNPNSNDLKKIVRCICPHHVSHYLGMDVHDTATVGRNRILEPGMVITVEPGAYISLENMDVYSEFRGMGIRVEDDVLITQNSLEVLSSKCPKDINDIENVFKTISK